MKQRYKLTIEYDGTSYVGFQKQYDIKQLSVEEVLETAIFKLSQEHVKITPCGRTDAGVHALGQVIHFDLDKKLAEKNVVMGLNSYLREEAVSVLSCELVDENFHARFNAEMRHYRYLIINRTAPLVLQKNRAWHVGGKKLDVNAMQEAANFLIGQHDFSSFRDAECQAGSPIRTVKNISVTSHPCHPGVCRGPENQKENLPIVTLDPGMRRGDKNDGGDNKRGEEIVIEISAKSFLHHMVRNIVGTLMWVGSGKISAEEVKRILEEKDRMKSGPNAPACGLYFLGVDYATKPSSSAISQKLDQ